MDSVSLQEKIERKYLLIILELINTNSITDGIIHESAKLIISMRPYLSYDDAKSKIEFMETKYEFMKDLMGYVIGLESEYKSKDIVNKMHAHLKQNDVDSALAVIRNNS